MAEERERMKEEERRRKVEADYAEALKVGEVPAAYARLMFLGAGGSGKSSLLDGLMNIPMRVAESTALADTLSIKYHWVEAADAAEDAWKARTEEDEIKELATLSRMVVNGKGEGSNIQNWDLAQAVKVFGSLAALHRVISDQQYASEASRIQKDVSKSVYDEAMQQDKQASTSKNPEVVMHIWDCGGQSIFLDIISAFLTSRTMFLLLFDASMDLNIKYQESWRHKGHTVPGRKQNISHIQLMMQWMQLIHGSLVIKDEKSQHIKEEASAREKPPLHPNVMMVGTRGDIVKSKEEVLKSLQRSCECAAYNDLIVGKWIIDNTTAGKGQEEDAGYKHIRKQVHKFVTSLIVPTPLAWVSFRNVVQKVVSDSPILSYSRVVAIAEICGIPETVVPSVLQFYHQLGVFLHYDNIPSLRYTVIAEPRWLIQQLRKILLPEWYQPRPQNMARFWKWLEERGVLLEQLYTDIWKDCGLEGGAQGLADLLEHFDLACKISQCPRDMDLYEGNKYFVPCMLNARPHDGSDREAEQITGQTEEAIRQAATLHIIFNIDYVPPGFFVRLVARMTNNKNYIPCLDRIVYRDSIEFLYNEIDRITIAESSSLLSIQVNVCRVSTRTHSMNRFAEACLSLRSELVTMCKEVLCWFPSIKLDFSFECNCPSRATQHFVYLDTDKHQESRLFCKKFDNEYKITSAVKYWLPRSQQEYSHLTHVEDGPLTEDEIKNVARQIGRGDVDVFAREIEMEYSLDDAKKDRNRSRSLAYAIISDFAEREHGTRYKLAKLLRSTRFVDASRELLKGELQVLPPTYDGSTSVMRKDKERQRRMEDDDKRENWTAKMPGRKESHDNEQQRTTLDIAQGSSSLIEAPLQSSAQGTTSSPQLSTTTTSETLGEDDLLDVSDYLIPLDKAQLHNLGLVLGLGYIRLKNLEDSRTFLNDVVYAWLTRVDRVAERGGVSWGTLVAALRHSRVGQNGIADKIEHEKTRT